MSEPKGLARDALGALRRLGACADRCEVRRDHPDYAELASGPLAVSVVYGLGLPSREPREYMADVSVELPSGRRVTLSVSTGASPDEALKDAVGRACRTAAALARHLLHLYVDVAASPDTCGDDSDCRRAAYGAENALAEFITDAARRAAEAARALGCSNAGEVEGAADGVKLVADAMLGGCG